jgi:hypothetical protein
MSAWLRKMNDADKNVIELKGEEGSFDCGQKKYNPMSGSVWAGIILVYFVAVRPPLLNQVGPVHKNVEMQHPPFVRITPCHMLIRVSAGRERFEFLVLLFPG